MHQLELDWNSPATLAQAIAQRMGRPVHITLTDNRSTMVSARQNARTGTLELRVHRMFVAAPPRVIEALADWLGGSRSQRTAETVDRFIADHRHAIPETPVRSVRMRVKGAVHDLGALYHAVNAAHFDHTVRCAISWGKMPAVKRRRSIRLGSYTQESNLIRIHPLLDQPFVPQWFVAFIVFHEMLHADLGIQDGPGGRRLIHPPAFRKREQAHPDYARAEAWIADEANLRRLLGHASPRRKATKG